MRNNQRQGTMRAAGFALAVCAVLCFCQTARAATPQDSPAVFSGFNPGVVINARTVLSSDKILSSVVKADESGTAQLAPGEDTAGMAYDFTIQDQGSSMAVLLKASQDGRSVALNGSGLKPFSKIVVETAQGVQELYSDWAGLIRADKIDLGQSEDLRPFQIALYGGIASDGQFDRPHPMLIKVDFAPPGAGTVVTPPGPFHHPSVSRNYIHPLQMFAEQMSAVAMHYMFAIGTFLDAKEQMEAQRDMQKLKAEAVKDYHPSEQMCMIGGFTKTLAATEAKGINDQQAVNAALFSAYKNLDNSSTMDGPDVDMKNRLQQYREIYCDPSDSNTALFSLCQHDNDGNIKNSTVGAAAPRGIGAQKAVRMNKDIDFVRTVDNPLTLDIDFTDNVLTDDEEDVMAMARNIYWPVPHKKVNDLGADGDQVDYTKARSIMAMSSLAHNSFAKIVAMKAKAPRPPIGDPGWAYMKTMMREFGMTDEQIVQLLGDNPSYYAQMDVLTKKMYQNPDFYTHLYDKPTNVSRMDASMEAIKLMQNRDHFEAALRREMLLSALVEEQLAISANKIEGKLLNKKDTNE